MSSVESFTKEQFEQALANALSFTNREETKLLSSGIVQGEYQYRIAILGTNKRLVVRSSVKSNGQSAGAGEDSIRIWAEYYYRKAEKWVSLGKLDRWTTRVTGWEKRLAEKVEELYNLALQDSGGRKALSPNNNTEEKKGKQSESELLGDKGEGTVEKKAVPSFLSTDDAVVKPTPKASTFTPSEYQQAVFDFVENGTGHGVVLAVAGSGKTTTIVKALEFTPSDKDVAFVAFNKRIATELSKRAPAHVHTSTLHSLGYSNIRSAFGNVQVKPNKLWTILRNVQDRMSWDDAADCQLIGHQVIKLVSLCKATLLTPTDENLDYICDRWNIEVNGLRELTYSTTARVYSESVKDTTTIDYDDMIFFCASGKVPCQQFDYLFVDETQDLNAAQLEMAVRSIKADGRIVAVGDEAQSIYGFRGADTQAVPNIIARLNATVLPLSITYRCPKSHVELAQALVPEIQPAEWAQDGVVETINAYQFTEKVQSGDLVLCRCNAPLVAPAFSLIRRGVKAVILGRDIGKGLVQFVKKVQKQYHVNSLGDTLAAMAEYTDNETAKLLQAKKTMRAQALEDKFETIIALADGCNTVYNLEQKIEQVFSDDEEGVTFSSIHKAKGGEAERVFILKPELMPHPKASEGWELEQERNIQYVAYTRSKSELYFVL